MAKIKYNKPIIELIKERKSIRNYEAKDLDQDIQDQLEQGILGLKGPFKYKVRLKLINRDYLEDEKGVKLGTYSVIKGAKTFLLGAVEKGQYDLEEIGYVLEEAILFATSLGLGTCWLGGTFRRGAFAKAMDLKENEILPAITPIGHGKDQWSLIDAFFKLSAGSKYRKDWKDLFFTNTWANPLSQEEAGSYSLPLEMVRLAPSASNKQPWRIVKEGERFHFYLEEDPKYNNKLGFDLQRLDIGVAMCHFQLTLEEMGRMGQWIIEPPALGELSPNTYYTATWVS